MTILCQSVVFEKLNYDHVPPLIRETYEGSLEVKKRSVDKTEMVFTIKMIGPG